MQLGMDLAASIARCTPNEGVNETCIDGLRLYRGHCDTPRQPVVYRPSICVVAQGQKRLFLGEHSFSYDTHNYLISSLTLPIEAEVSGTSPEHAYLGLSLDVDPGLVSQLIVQMDLHQHGGPAVKGAEIISCAPITPHLKQCLGRLVALTTNPMDRDILGASVKREIFYEVLKGPQGGLLRNCVSNHSGASRLAAVVHFIEANFHRSLDIDALTKIAQMSPSALHEQFKALTSLPPMQFVKNLRLHHARSLLLSGTTASDASYQVGYSSPSQFSREFKRLFGYTPTQSQAQTG